MDNTTLDITQLNGWPAILKRDKKGEIVAAIVMYDIHQLEFFINPEWQQQGLWKEMAELMKKCCELVKPYYAICRSDKVAAMATKMGMQEIHGVRVFVMPKDEVT